MQNFKELKVWEKAHQITQSIYTVSAKFPKEEIYSLTNQLQRTSSSISANETEYFLILSKGLGYPTAERFSILSKSINEVKAMLIN